MGTDALMFCMLALPFLVLVLVLLIGAAAVIFCLYKWTVE